MDFLSPIILLNYPGFKSVIYISLFRFRAKKKNLSKQQVCDKQYICTFIYFHIAKFTQQTKSVKGKYWEGLVKKKTLAEMMENRFPGSGKYQKRIHNVRHLKKGSRKIFRNLHNHLQPKKSREKQFHYERPFRTGGCAESCCAP